MAIPRTKAPPIDRIGRAQTVKILCSALLLFALFPHSLHAQSPDASNLFAQGRAAFERQDFAAALAAFEAALAAHMSGPAIHFNIGVAAYKAQRYDRAHQAFEETARTPTMAALAHYNLGLVAKAQGDEQAAHRYFELVLAETQDQRLRTLAQASLGPSPEAAPESHPVWAAFASTGLGYDDNVALVANGQSLGVSRESDTYFDGLFAGSVQLGEQWRLDADVGLLRYAELNDFDQATLGTGARYRFDDEDWRTDVGGQFALTYMDGDEFEQRHSLYVQTNRTLSNLWTMRARYRVSKVEGGGGYSGLDGWRHEAALRFTYTSLTWTANATYLFDLGDFASASLSATRHQVLFDARKFVTPVWTVRSTLSVRQSEYEDESIGTENRFEVGLGAERAIDDRWSVILRYLYTDNDADAPELDYERSRIQIGAEAAF